MTSHGFGPLFPASAKQKLSFYPTCALCYNASSKPYQVVTAQWLVLRLATGEVPGLNSGKGDNYKF